MAVVLRRKEMGKRSLRSLSQQEREESLSTSSSQKWPQRGANSER
jgi:hypothetical protein